MLSKKKANDFCKIKKIVIFEEKHPILKIEGFVYIENYEFFLLKNQKEKIKLNAKEDEQHFIIYQELNNRKQELSLYIKVNNKEYKITDIQNKIENVLCTSFYKLYYNRKIDFERITLGGVAHPRLILIGTKENQEQELVFKSNGQVLKNVHQEQLKNKFQYFVDLQKTEKKIEVYDGKDRVLEIRNNLSYRLGSKIGYSIKRIFLKIFHIFYVFYRGIRAAWKQYHFLIPPKLWKKYWLEFKNKMKSQENKQFYNVNSIEEYNKWLLKHSAKEEEQELKYQPLISILIPVYNIKREYLEDCIYSILNQTYPHFEICLVDDASTKEETLATLKELAKVDKRIKIEYHSQNQHISVTTNDALKMSKGEFVGLVDNDDTLTPDALYEVVKALNENKKWDFIYSDEDKINKEGKRCYPHFKPDFSPDTLLSLNYICHFSVIRKTIMEKVGGFEKGLEGAQDHDLFLKISEVTDKIYHIPKILYHWHMIEGSTSATIENKSYANDKGKKAIENALKRRKLNGEVKKDDSGYYIVDYKLKKEPFISIIIPTRDYANILDKCLTSLYEKTTYHNFEVLVVNNNSTEEKTFSLFEKYKKAHKNFRVIDANIEFNYSKINNLAVKEAQGEYIVLLNNDTEIITPEWLDKMVGYASLEHIGAVGAKLLYPDSTIQHGGVILGLGGVASHAYIGSSRNETGLYGRLRVPYNYSAVTAACLMIKKSKFESVNGLEEKLKVAYNDIDFNLKLLEKGYYNIFLPQVELFHHESKSRGYDTTSEKYERFLKEQEFMYKKWQTQIENDRMYNPNFSKRGWFVLDRKEKKK